MSALGTVWWADDPERKRDVVKLCARCQHCRHGWLALEGIGDVQIVSTAGVGHLEGDNGDTLCGIDATGENWWWHA